jgi:hypothetical protein
MGEVNITNKTTHFTNKLSGYHIHSLPYHNLSTPYLNQASRHWRPRQRLASTNFHLEVFMHINMESIAARLLYDMFLTPVIPIQTQTTIPFQVAINPCLHTCALSLTPILEVILQRRAPRPFIQLKILFRCTCCGSPARPASVRLFPRTKGARSRPRPRGEARDHALEQRPACWEIGYEHPDVHLG